MKSSTTILLSLLAAIGTAQPHRQHRHQHAKRSVEPVIEWVTEYEYTTEVVPVTETLWVSAGWVPPESTPTSLPKNTVPAQFFEPASKRPSSSSTLITSTTSVAPVQQVAPTTTAAANPVPAPPPAAAPSVEEKPLDTPVPVVPSVEPVSTPTPVAPSASAPPATSAAASVPESSTSSASASGSAGGSTTGGPCSSGNACQGDITHYDANVGLGACGWQSDGTSENVVALSHLLMGTQSNGNPYCGQSITVKLNGKSVTAKVVDKCMGCAIHAIDLSEHAFSELEDMSVGRTQVEWYFN